jgi:isoamylase
MQTPSIQTGSPMPLGAAVADGGVNFAIASEHATAVDLCLFDASGQVETARLRLPGHDDGVFHGFVPGCKPGMHYGYRVHGAHAPHQGQRFNPQKVLLDPYAREIAGEFVWDSAHADNVLDNAALALKAVVVQREAPPLALAARVSAASRVLYEVHVKGFSKLNLDIPPQLRGTYAGLAHAASIDHLKRLGVTSLCLLPVHAAIDEQPLATRGLRNYWGYNSVGFFAPSTRLAAQAQDARAEFRAMVSRLHAAGVEVILDVVFNHTAESNEHGPVISWRGIDNAMYYRLTPRHAQHYENITGCGNTLNIAHPRVMHMVLDSLRYWVSDMGVDGFRFDLAAVLGETAHGFDACAPLFQAIAQDPVLAHTTLIAEPWHTGAHGYKLGAFPARWLEWNDKFRDTVRRFWLRKGVNRGEFARRFLASADVFHRAHRRPAASVNYVCAHDGFTLADLVSYNHKHNDANGEANRDGRDGEVSFNHGAEGATYDASIIAQRQQTARVLLATLLLAQGTPMLRAGDERMQSQQGNNNAYCQDNETSWLNWGETDATMARFAAKLLALRQHSALLTHPDWFAAAPQAQAASVQWFAPNGHVLQAHEWNDPHAYAFAALFTPALGQAQPQPLWIGFNAGTGAVDLALPQGQWRTAIDCAQPFADAATYQNRFTMAAHNLMVLAPATASLNV